MNESKYLLRYDDYMVFERQEDGLYNILGSDRPQLYSHFTYDNLVGLGFMPIKKRSLDMYAKLRKAHYASLHTSVGCGDDGDSC